MGKTSYKSVKDLVKNLSKNVDKLNKGELSLEELDTLVESCKDLYEHMVILRYKAFDTFGEPKEVVQEEPETTPEISETAEDSSQEDETSFDFTGMSSEDDTQQGFDFTFEDNTEEAIVEEKQEVEEEVQEATPSNAEQQIEPDDPDSLNDRLKQDEELSLRKKLQNTPVEDIKTHISIAKKFEYINNMFGGDADTYNQAIEELNSCNDAETARLKLDDYGSKYEWNLEDKSIIKFIELVERRYI